MKHFYIYLKKNEACGYDDEVIAENEEEAKKIFMRDYYLYEKTKNTN